MMIEKELNHNDIDIKHEEVMDYYKKCTLYAESGVREYWIVDPVKECTTKYHFEEDSAPVIVPFSAELKAEIYQKQLSICIAGLLE